MTSSKNRETVEMPTTTESDTIPVLVEIKGDIRLDHAVNADCVIGRSPECSVWLMDRLVSRRHALIDAPLPGAYRIRDLGSKFGTFLNRKAITESVLRPGDKVFLGATLLRFQERPASDVCIRRHQNRLHCSLDVRAIYEDVVFDTVATDISLGGVRLEWTDPPAPGTAMVLEIAFPGQPERHILTAHASHKSDDFGLGVRFYYNSEADERSLAEAYAKLYLENGEV